ncbi:MAG: hypothetical protein GY754_17660 [bacterium]|nr:hypothetical protein [bacterium]
MYLHLGDRKIISGSKLLGIFNAETIKKSELNDGIISRLSDSDKSVIIDKENNITTSKVSPFTLLKRTVQENEFIWRRSNG